jgi:hypothetical protein
VLDDPVAEAGLDFSTDDHHIYFTVDGEEFIVTVSKRRKK